MLFPDSHLPIISCLSLSLKVKNAVRVAYGGVTKKTVTKEQEAEVKCKEHVCVDRCVEHVSVPIFADLAAKDQNFWGLLLK